MKRFVSTASYLMLIAIVSACQPSSQGLEVRDYWLRSATQGGNTAMYMSIENHSPEIDELIGVSSKIAEAVEIHETMIDSNGAMQMSPVASLPLEPGAEIIFEPGGLHVMFIGLKQDLKVGDTIEVTLQFKKHQDINVTVPIQEAGGDMDH